MAKTIIMPRFGMTQEEATIVKWIKQEGERVETGDPICEVTTDKINMEVEAPVDGILAGLRYAEGETVPVAEVIAYIVAEGEAPPAGGPVKEAISPVTSPAVSEPLASSQLGTTLAPEMELKATPVARRMANAEGLDLAAISGSGQDGQITRQDVERYLASQADRPGGQAAAGKVRATPAARRLARQGQIDLTQVTGSGLQGRVQGWDVQEAIEKNAVASKAGQLPTAPAPIQLPSQPISAPTSTQPQRIQLEGMRRTIAQRMQASWQQTPHTMFTLDINMSQAVTMREQFNARFGGGKPVVSMTAVMVKACAAALRQHPLLNSYFRDEQILVMPQVNVGVAVALEEGLIVPVVRDADLKSLYQIGQEVSDLSQRARQGSLRPEDVVDGTFTISNLGMFGVDQFTAIINPPQVAILATGRIARRYVPDENDRPALHSMMTVTLSVDHRAVDGAGAARFLSTLGGILETAGAQWG